MSGFHAEFSFRVAQLMAVSRYFSWLFVVSATVVTRLHYKQSYLEKNSTELCISTVYNKCFGILPTIIAG